MDKWLELLKNNDYLGVKKYIRDGADVNDTNEAGEGVLTCAVKAHCDNDLINLLINSGADIFDFDDEGVSVFDTAISYNDIKLVRYIIEKGIDINKTTRRSGFTPLMSAVAYSRIEIIEILLENGVDVDALDSKGFSAMDFAKKLNKKSVLEMLTL